MLQRAWRCTTKPLPRKNTLLSLEVSLLWLVRRAFVEEVVNLSRRRSVMTRRWKRSISAVAIPAAGIPLYLDRMPPLRSGVRRLQVQRWGGGPQSSHQGPPSVSRNFMEMRLTDGHTLRPTSRLRARPLFFGFIYLTFLFLLSFTLFLSLFK